MADADQALAPTPTSEAAGSPPAPDAPAPSSGEATGDHGDSREQLLEAVQQAVPPDGSRPSQPDDAPDSAAPAHAAQSGEGDDLPDEVSAAELAKYDKTARGRIKKLINQRNASQAALERINAEVAPRAAAADSVQKFLADNDIGRDDFMLMLELGSALRKGDFQRFYAGISPYMKLAEEYLGISLPPDLQERVRQGHMTTPAAQAFSRERMERAMMQSNLQRTQLQARHFAHQSQTQAQQFQRHALANQVRDTVNAWEAKVAESDPDYGSKRAAVQDTMWAVVRERGVPQSPQHAVQIAQEALKRVNDRFRTWAPQRRPTMRTPSSTGRTVGVLPEPKTLADAVRIARETARL